MRWRRLLIAGLTLGILPVFADHQVVHAQVRINDLIRIMPAIRGANNNPTGQWCVSQGWHESYEGPPAFPYPAGPLDAVDEVSQYGSPGWTWANCHSNNGDLVDLAYNGSKDGGTNCTTANPCPSLIANAIGRVYGNGCHAIEIDLYDFATYVDSGTGAADWKGKQRFLHAYPTSVPWTQTLSVAYFGWYYNWLPVGTVVDEPVTCPWPQANPPAPAGYHVHHDFMLPTLSNYCNAGWNTLVIPNSPGQAMDLQRSNPDHYVHFLSHQIGVACVVPGDEVANILLGRRGLLDDTGAGTRQLAETGTSLTTATVECFVTSTWCGQLTVDTRLLQEVYGYYIATQEPVPTDGQVIYAYPILGGVMRVQWVSNWGPGVTYQWVSTCRVKLVPGEPMYDVSVPANTDPCPSPPPTPYGAIARVGRAGLDMYWAMANGAMATLGPDGYWTGFPRPTPTQARTWVLDQLNAGHWNDASVAAVKPLLDTVMRSRGKSPRDMERMGIQPYDPNNRFDGKRW